MANKKNKTSASPRKSPSPTRSRQVSSTIPLSTLSASPASSPTSTAASSSRMSSRSTAVFWAWGFFWFILIGGITALILGLANPSIVQQPISSTQASGAVSPVKVAMGGIVMGVIALIIYVFIVMRYY